MHKCTYAYCRPVMSSRCTEMHRLKHTNMHDVQTATCSITLRVQLIILSCHRQLHNVEMTNHFAALLVQSVLHEFYARVNLANAKKSAWTQFLTLYVFTCS